MKKNEQEWDPLEVVASVPFDYTLMFCHRQIEFYLST